jgi:RNA polymerase sigma factor (sigma-70 family)
MMEASSAVLSTDAFRRAGPAPWPDGPALTNRWDRTLRLILGHTPSTCTMSPDAADPGGRSDAELVAACRQGDARAWRELVDRYRRLVYGIPRSLGLQPADADEIFQQTFSELVRSLSRIRQADRLEAWLVTTAHRACFRFRRVEHRRARLHEAAALEWPAEDPPADAAIERLREGERLRRVVDSLGDPCRGLIIGLFADPVRPYRVLARELGIAIGSIGATRARCLERLRRRISRGRPGVALHGRPSPGDGS